MRKAYHDRFVVSLQLLLGLGVFRGCGQLLRAQVRAQSCERLAGEFQAIVCQHQLSYSVWDDPAVAEYIRHVDDRNLSCWISLCKFGLSVGNNDYVALYFTRLKESAQDFHCGKVQRSCSQK